MWPPPWLSSPRRDKLRRHTSFSCSSFKDIQNLCREEELEARQPRSPSIFHRVRISTSVLRAWANNSRPAIHAPPPPSVTLYFTSLRVVRRTYEDCRAVRSILRGLRLQVDERDLSMDGKFLDELQQITGVKKPSLPCVLIGGKLIGGAEEVRQLHESGELKRLLGGCPASGGSCDACGGVGYAVCEECSGSHKIYSEKSGFRSCTACNVSGLIRCPSCSSPYPRSIGS
ncbi:hypothetical protein CDL15_Pgr022508 [Punica granatum]|uniref:Glutaredoxin domain-containing protein n=1 Tax=Punica granatum TaxID=22663 RepID=A0A218XQZ2_PUNGR|nr:hypothetical protein CDL15_Pgr022508 [Punica granatum]PKI46697.1 hypothetical protein CRG98_033039 [Punica granatum]